MESDGSSVRKESAGRKEESVSYRLGCTVPWGAITESEILLRFVDRLFPVPSEDFVEEDVFIQEL